MTGKKEPEVRNLEMTRGSGRLREMGTAGRALPLGSSVILGTLLPEPQLLQLQNGEEDSMYLTELLWRINEAVAVKCQSTWHMVLTK